MALKLSKWLFLILIVSLPLVRPFNFIIFGLLAPYTDFIFLVSFAFWILALVQRQTAIRNDKLYIFIGFYALAFTISTVFSTNPRNSFFKLLGEYYLFALFVLTFNLVREKGFFKQVVFAWLIGTGLTILASLAGFLLFYLGLKTQSSNYFLSHFGSLPSGDYPRIRALFANANMMCNFLNISLMLAVLAGRLGWLKRVPGRLLQIGIWHAAIFTFSAGLGGMLLSLAVWHWAILKAGKKNFLSKLVLVSGIFIAAVFFTATLISPDTKNTNQQIKLPFTDKALEVSVRVLVWQDTIQNFLEYPFFGKGTGTDVAEVRYETLSGDRQILLDAHNIWLNILGQTGLFGLTALILLTAYLITKCKFRVEDENIPDLILLALSCSFIGVYLYQGLSVSYEDARHLWILIGLLAAGHVIINSKTGISEASKTP